MWDFSSFFLQMILIDENLLNLHIKFVYYMFLFIPEVKLVEIWFANINI